MVIQTPQPLEAMTSDLQTGDGEISAICDAAAAVFPDARVVLSFIEEVQTFLSGRSATVDGPLGVTCEAFCAQTIRDKSLFEILDARRDGRFSAHPMVTGSPYLVYYAGVPLRLADGSVPGALSLVGSAPRAKLDETELKALEDFAARISNALEPMLQLVG